VTLIAARLPLRSWRSLLPALARARRLRRALREVPGAAGCSFAVQLRDPALWTVSAWTSRTDLTAFEQGAAHQAAKTDLLDRLRPATFAVWDCPGPLLPVRWSDVQRRIEDATGGQPR
jgi:hypothetical protein